MAGRKGGRASGRASIFPLKKHRRQGHLTQSGKVGFEAARRRLADLAGWKASGVSDSDTMEYLSIGEAATIAFLNAKEQQ